MAARVTFERSTDLHLVREILTDPRCWRRIIDDQAPAPGDFVPKHRPDLEYILARENGRPAALFVLLHRLDYTEVHFCFCPEAWGRSEAIALAFVAWVWRNTDILRLVGPVPQHNYLALRLARKVGFSELGRIRSHVLRRGKLYDLVILQADRPDYRREAGKLHEPQPTPRTLSPRT